MKKKLIFAAGAMIIAAAVSATVYVNRSADRNDLFEQNLEALAKGEGVKIYTCLGLWGECTLPSGTTSKAPAVEVETK